MPIAADPGFAKGLVYGLAECDTQVFNSVMRINLQIAICDYVHIDKTMARYLLKHVFEKRQPRLNFEFAGAIKINTHLDTGFVGIAFYAGLALRHEEILVRQQRHDYTGKAGLTAIRLR